MRSLILRGGGNCNCNYSIVQYIAIIELQLLIAEIIIIAIINFFNYNNFFILLGITLIFFSLHSYDSLCQRGSELVLVIRLSQLYWKLGLNLRILGVVNFECVKSRFPFPIPHSPNIFIGRGHFD